MHAAVSKANEQGSLAFCLAFILNWPRKLGEVTQPARYNDRVLAGGSSWTSVKTLLTQLSSCFPNIKQKVIP